MPVAAVDKDDRVMPREDDVRSPGKLGDMKPEPESPRMKGAPQHEFRPSVSASDSRHHPRPSGGIYNVSHEHLDLFARGTERLPQHAGDTSCARPSA